MLRKILLLGFLALLSIISGVLMSEVSWIGRMGMRFFYKEFELLKIWWQGALLVYSVLIVMYIVQAILLKVLPGKISKIIFIVLLLAGMAGMYATYNDFREDFSHRLAGERFHIGFYLFWVGSIMTSFFFLLEKGKTKKTINSSSKDVVNQ